VTLSPRTRGPQFTWPQSTRLSQLWAMRNFITSCNGSQQRNSAIAERIHCRVCQFRPKVEDYKHYRSSTTLT